MARRRRTAAGSILAVSRAGQEFASPAAAFPREYDVDDIYSEGIRQEVVSLVQLYDQVESHKTLCSCEYLRERGSRVFD